MECWRRKRYRINRKSGENREMIRWNAVGEERDGASEQSEEVMTRSKM